MSKAFLIYGRAKPRARRQSTAQRSKSRRRCSNRLRRVSRGGEGIRNMRELKDLRSRVVRRMRWKITGSATARPPSRKSGARKFMEENSKFETRISMQIRNPNEAIY